MLKRSVKILVSIAVTLLLAVACSMPSEFRKHGEFIQSDVVGNPNIKSAALRTGEVSLAYHYRGNANAAVVVWVHGTPGSWTDIGRLLVDENFLQEVKLVSIDRPGWGASQNTGSPQVYPRFDDQVKYISPLLALLKEQHPNVPLLIVGHSWGGSLAPAIVASNTDTVDGMLILAGGLSPLLTKPRWYNKVAKYWPIRAVIGPELRKSNIEMYALASNLASLSGLWQSLSNTPIIVVQGGKDPLVNPDNADFAAQVLEVEQKGGAEFNGARQIRKIIKKPDYGHLLQIKHTDFIADCIIELADAKVISNSLCI